MKGVFANRLQKEIPWGTANHYLTAKFKGEEALPGALLEDFLASSKVASLFGEIKAGRIYTESQTIDALRSGIESARDRWSTQFQAKSLHEQQQERLFCAVKALWHVEHKTFVDYVLKETTEHFLAPSNQWMKTTLMTKKHHRGSYGGSR